MLNLVSIHFTYHNVGTFLYVFAFVVTVYGLHRQTKRVINETLDRGPEKDAERMTDKIVANLGEDIVRHLGGKTRITNLMLCYPDLSGDTIFILLMELFYDSRRLGLPKDKMLVIAGDFITFAKQHHAEYFSQKWRLVSWDSEAAEDLEHAYDFIVQEHLQAVPQEYQVAA